MQELYKPTMYPKEVREAVQSMSGLALEIANRWALGWPSKVKALLDNGTYLAELTEQHEREAKVLSESAGTRHLARHEIQELYGINPYPPAV